MNIDPFQERRERERRDASTAGSCGYEYAKDLMRKNQNSQVEKNGERVRARLNVFKISPEIG